VSRDDDYYLSDRTIDGLAQDIGSDLHRRADFHLGASGLGGPRCISRIYTGAFHRKEFYEGLQKTIADEIMLVAEEVINGSD